MTMFYVKAIDEKRDIQLNAPGVDTRAIFDAIKAEFGDKCTVVEIKPLFDFDYSEPEAEKLVRAN
jgi:hypothetical protein